jgi:type II secretion system protein H
MTLRTGKNDFANARAFTLVELLVVLSLIAVVVALAAPTLSHFFQGRTQDSEVRRFLALTHYGQSRAVSEGVPMLLWIDAKAGTYGLQQEAGYTDGDTNSVEYALGKDLKIDVMNAANATQPAHTGRNQPAIRFMPDGGVDTASLAGVTFREGDGSVVKIVKSANGLAYEVKN